LVVRPREMGVQKEIARSSESWREHERDMFSLIVISVSAP